MPHGIEDTGGLFIQTPDDDPDYAEKWVAACSECGIETEEISPAQALKQEPFLNPKLERAFVCPMPCATVRHPHGAGAAVQQRGGTVLTDHEVVGLSVAGGKVTGGCCAIGGRARSDSSPWA